MVMPTPQGYRGDGVMDNFWKLIERHRVTFLITVPTAVSALMQRKVDADVSTLRLGDLAARRRCRSSSSTASRRRPACGRSRATA